MRKLLFFSLIIVGCKNQDTGLDGSRIDSLIKKADVVIATSDSVQRVSDSITTMVIDQATKNFDSLKNEIESVKKIQKIQTEKIIYRIDTIYVEKKKNFWGKTKTTTKITSDSTISNTSDSTNEE